MSAADKQKEVFIPTLKEKPGPPMKPEDIVIGAPIAPVTPAVEEGRPVLREDYYVPLSANAPTWELTEKASMSTAL